MQKLSDAQIAEQFEPCPFCGGEIIVFQVMHPTLKEPAWYIESKEMGCLLPRTGGFVLLRELIDEWNCRPVKVPQA